MQTAANVCVEFGLTVQVQEGTAIECVLFKRENRPVQPDTIKKRLNEVLVDKKRGAKSERTRIAVVEGKISVNNQLQVPGYTQVIPPPPPPPPIASVFTNGNASAIKSLQKQKVPKLKEELQRKRSEEEKD